MAIYGTPITMGGGGGSNDTLPPLLDNFKAKRADTNIVLTANKMPVSRANALAGAVWVYGDHIPQNKNDGTKIELTRDEVIKPDSAPFITLADIPVSDADTGTVVNLKESDGQLHPYLYLHNNYEGGGAGLLLRKDIYQVAKYNDSGTNIYENTTLDLWCENTFVAMLDSSVKSKLNSVSIPVRNGLDSTESTLDRQCFVLSSDELGVQTSAVIGSKLPYFSNDTRRIATYNTSNQGYFTRTMYSLGGIIVINGSGTSGLVTNNATTFGYRPAFCLPLTFQLNPTPNPDGSYDMYEESSAQTLATGKTIADLPSKSKVKLGRYGGKDLVWELTKDTSNQALRMILNASSMDIIGGKMFDNKEPSNPDSNRRDLGNNRYIWSNLHQWLNSDKPANQWYAAQHKYDAPPNYTNINGFLYEWNESERNVLDSTNWTVTRHSADGGGSEVFQSRVTLPSTTEMGLNVNTGGGRLDIFNNDTDRKARLAYWCRTPHTGLAYNVLVVSNSGTEGASGGANNPNLLVRPLCSPNPSTLVSNEPDFDGCYTIQIEPTTIERTISWDTNKNFYARQFTYNSKKQYQTMLEGATAELLLGEVPLPVSNLTISENAGASPTLSWKNPTDKNYHETVVVQKEGSTPPRSTDDGIEVYRGAGESVTVKDLQSTVDYSFGVFTLSPYGNYGEPSTISYRYDFPSEPTDYLDCAEISETTEYEIPEDGWFRIDAISKAGNGGSPATSENPDGYGMATCGGGASGSHARSELPFNKGDKISITVSGNVEVKKGDDTLLQVTAGGNGGKAGAKGASAGTGGKPGTATGGNKVNENGVKGAAGIKLTGTSFERDFYGGNGGTLTIQINTTESYTSKGGRGAGGRREYHGDMTHLPATNGTGATVFISRGNTNIPSPQ